MVTYQSGDEILVKIFKSPSPENLEDLINSWISENTNRYVVDIVYSSHHSINSGDVYTALMTHINKVAEEEM